MSPEFGSCLPKTGEVSPATVAAIGARWIRLTADPTIDLTGYLALCHAARLKVILDYDSDSLSDDESAWPSRFRGYAATYGHLVDVHEVGNEPDNAWDGQRSLAQRRAESPASWCMEPLTFDHLLATARRELGPKATIIAGGLSSGQPAYLNNVILLGVDGIALHSYGRRPWGTPADHPYVPGQFGTLGELFAAYGPAAAGRPLYLTEYNAAAAPGQVSRADMAMFVRDSISAIAAWPNVAAATWFCWDDSMVRDLGLYVHGKPTVAASAFKLATDKVHGPVVPEPPVPEPTPEPIPMPDTFSVGDGMRALMAKRGDVPASDEIYFKGPNGKDEFSEAMAASGRLYRYVFATGQTYSFTPEAA